MVMLITSLASAEYFARESFKYAVGDTIDDALATTTCGWGGAWKFDPKHTWGAGCYAIVGDTDLVYDNMLYPVPYFGSHLTVFTPGGWQGAISYERSLDKTWPNEAGKVYWTSHIFDVEWAGMDSSTYYLFKLFYYGADTSELFAVGKGGGAGDYTCGSGWPGASGADVSDVTCEGGPVWLVTATYMSGDSTCRTFMWVDPDPNGAAPDTNEADVKRNSTMPNGFNTITVEIGGNARAHINYDEIRLGDSWDMVTTSTETFLAVESFEYATGDTIDDASAIPANGWGDVWVFDSGHTWGSGCYAIVGDTDLVYDNMLYPVNNIGNHLTLFTPGGWQGAISYERSLDKTWPNEAGKVYWTSHIFDVEWAGMDSSTYYLFKLFYYGADTSELFAVGKGGGAGDYTCGSGWPGASGADVSDVTCEGGPVWLVTATYMSGDSTCRTFMWVDPDPNGAAPDTNEADVKRNSTMPNGFNTITVEIGGNARAHINYDEIRIADSWTNVVKIAPEKPENPAEFRLAQNYPNPFNPTTTIAYSLQRDAKVTLAVYDILGREVATLVNGAQIAGQHKVSFSGENLATGVYIYRLQVADKIITKKMALVK
jgi:hypothetical protein